MVMLEIYLLGAPRLCWDRSLISIPRRQVRALLYRLAAEMEPISREHLCWLFWPDATQCEAHRNLSHLLTHLRHFLPLDLVLACNDDAISLVPQYTWSDSAAFLGLMSRRQNVITTSEAEEAISLYHGPFLDSFVLDSSSEYENWIVMQRSLLERHYLTALSLLAEKEKEKRHYPVAISYLQRSLAVDPLDESTHRELMEIYAAAGNRVAALREFDDYSDTLRREMAMEPLPETQALIRQLCNGYRMEEAGSKLQDAGGKKQDPAWQTA
ncbi:MAG: BTAD domain-containing putative transcriptional regulator [Caldilineaceae bacterium]